MLPKIKNIIIFLVILAVLILGYMLFFKQSPTSSSLVSSGESTGGVDTTSRGVSAGDNSGVAQDFLTLLLSIRGISLDDSIFSTPAFNSLQDSSVVLIPDGTEGRPNPFAPIGTDIYPTPPPTPENTSTDATSTTTTPPTVNSGSTSTSTSSTTSTTPPSSSGSSSTTTTPPEPAIPPPGLSGGGS